MRAASASAACPHRVVAAAAAGKPQVLAAWGQLEGASGVEGAAALEGGPGEGGPGVEGPVVGAPWRLLLLLWLLTDLRRPVSRHEGKTVCTRRAALVDQTGCRGKRAVQDSSGTCRPAVMHSHRAVDCTPLIASPTVKQARTSYSVGCRCLGWVTLGGGRTGGGAKGGGAAACSAATVSSTLLSSAVKRANSASKSMRARVG